MFVRAFVLASVLVAATVPFAAAQPTVKAPDQPRVLDGAPPDAAGLAAAVERGYGDLLDARARDATDREHLKVRLGLALRLFNRGLADLAHRDQAPAGAGSGNKLFGPSPAALSRLEAILPTLPDGEGAGSGADYAAKLQPRLAALGGPAFRQLMYEVAGEAVRHKALFAGDVNPLMDDDAWRRAQGIMAEAAADAELPKPDPRQVPLPFPAAALSTDQPAGVDLVAQLPATTVGPLAPTFIAKLTDRQLETLLASLAQVDAPEAARNLAALTAERDRRAAARAAQVAAKEAADEGAATADGTTITADGTEQTRLEERERELGGSVSNVPSWFDVTLRTLADFVPTDKAGDRQERTVYDPKTGKKVKLSDVQDPFDQFGLEVIQDQTEGVMQRMPGTGN